MRRLACALCLVPVCIAAILRIPIARAADANGASFSSRLSLSADGRTVVFTSDATNLAPGDANAARDVFVFDTTSSRLQRASQSSGGAAGNGASDQAAISADGRFVAFESSASNLVAGDSNSRSDIFVFEVATGITTRVSVITGGAQANGDSRAPALSADGRYVSFLSFATNLVAGDSNFNADTFLHDRQTGTTTRMSVRTGGAEATGGTGVLITADATDVSDDGNRVCFESDLSTLVDGDGNNQFDIFVRDRAAGTTQRVSTALGGGDGNASSVDPAISADGRYVVFESDASNLVSGDTNGTGDVFVHDLQTGVTTRVNVSSAGVQASSFSNGAGIGTANSAVFESLASNLVSGGNGQRHGYVRDLLASTTTRVTLTSTGGQGNDASFALSPSGSGTRISFTSQATNMVPGDANATFDVFLRDMVAGTTVRVSEPSDVLLRTGFESP